MNEKQQVIAEKNPEPVVVKETPAKNEIPQTYKADNSGEQQREENIDEQQFREKAHEENSAETSSGLHDYDPDSNDWYRLRKSRWDPASQVGAYKTVEKAMEYAAIYRPQGYVLYDKDFNPIY